MLRYLVLKIDSSSSDNQDGQKGVTKRFLFDILKDKKEAEQLCKMLNETETNLLIHYKLEVAEYFDEEI